MLLRVLLVEVSLPYTGEGGVEYVTTKWLIVCGVLTMRSARMHKWLIDIF